MRTVAAREAEREARLDDPVNWEPSVMYLKGAVGFIVAGNTAFSLGILLFTQGQIMRAVFSLAFLLVGGVAWVFLARGQTRTAVWTLGVGIWLMVTGTSFFHGGVRSTAIMFYPPVIMLAGWMGGLRAAMPVAVASAAATLLFVIGDWAGFMPEPPLLLPILRWLIEAFVFIFTAFTTQYVIRAYRKRLDEVRSLGIALERRSEEVERLNVSLEERVRERTRELERANRELAEFSYTISHDMRAPLRSVAGFSGLLAESMGDKLNAAERDLLERVGTSGNRMNRLIDAMLEYLRLGRVEVTRLPLALDRLVAEIVAEVRVNYPGTEIIVHPLGEVLADPDMARQIFRRLIGNALKHSASVPAPRVEVGAHPAAAYVEYFVSDNGVGFDMRHAEHLFGMFTRLRSDPDADSTGAGLALVKRMVERHGGTIRAEATPGHGATFRFHL